MSHEDREDLEPEEGEGVDLVAEFMETLETAITAVDTALYLKGEIGLKATDVHWVSAMSRHQAWPEMVIRIGIREAAMNMEPLGERTISEMALTFWPYGGESLHVLAMTGEITPAVTAELDHALIGRSALTPWAEHLRTYIQRREDKAAVSDWQERCAATSPEDPLPKARWQWELDHYTKPLEEIGTTKRGDFGCCRLFKYMNPQYEGGSITVRQFGAYQAILNFDSHRELIWAWEYFNRHYRDFLDKEDE